MYLPEKHCTTTQCTETFQEMFFIQPVKTTIALCHEIQLTYGTTLPLQAFSLAPKHVHANDPHCTQCICCCLHLPITVTTTTHTLTL